MTDIKQIEAKHREFWVLEETIKFGPAFSSDPKDHACIPLLMRIPINEASIHLVEIAALIEAQARIEKLEKAVEVMRNALEYQRDVPDKALHPYQAFKFMIRSTRQALAEVEEILK